MVADRYFAILPEHIDGFRAALVPDGDVLPLDVLPNCKQLATLSDGRVLLHVRLGQRHIEDMAELAGCADPLSLAAVQTLDIAGSYVGMDRAEVLAAFPELSGTVTHTDPETGETFETPILPDHRWA